MSRSLFIVNSVYHLLTAVNLRRQAPAGEEAHLLLTDVTPGLRERIPSLVETGPVSYTHLDVYKRQEDRDSYRRRSVSRRLREAALRGEGFAALGISPPLAAWGILRPLAACLVPGRVLHWVKRRG